MLIQKLIIDKAADQLKGCYVPWARKSVMELIEAQAGIKLAIRTIDGYLFYLGLLKSLKECL